MKNIFYILILIGGLVSSTLSAQQVEKSTYGTFALTNATIETVTKGQVNGTLIIEDGKITAIGNEVTIPIDATTINCEGMTIYPGLIDGGTTLGLSEVGSISLTQDYREIGNITPHVQALTAVNPNSVLIPVTRVNGITTVLTKPAGGLFSGTAALINLSGYTPNQMYAGFKGIVMNFPSTGKRGRRDRRSKEDINKDAEKALKELNETWERAKQFSALYADDEKGMEYNPAMKALMPSVKGEGTVLIEVNSKDDILSAIKWVKKNEVKAVLMGVSDGWRVADTLAASGIPVITGPILSTPRRSSDKYDRPYANAGLMHAAGVKVAIRTNETENVRNLPFNAGFAAAYGMGKDAALKAVTIVPAEIFGVADQIGSLEVGKMANLFVANGDPFETKTQIQHLFISGWKVPLESRHTLLYDEFLERSPGLEKQ